MLKRPPILAHFITLGLIATLPLLALLGYNIYAQYQNDRAGAIAHLETLRLASAQQVRPYLQDVEYALAYVARNPALQTPDKARLTELLKEAQTPRPELANLAVLDPAGHILAGVYYVPDDPNITLREFAWYREGLDATGFHVSQPFQGSITHKWTCVASYPVVDPAGHRIATLMAPFNLLELSKRFFFETPNPDSIISIIDASGVMLMRSYDAEKWIGTSSAQIHEAFARRAAGQRTGEITGRDGRRRIYTMDWIPGTTWSIGASLPYEIIFASADANLRRSLLLFAGFTIVLGFLVIRLARNFSRPIISLAQSVRAQQQGQPGPAALVTGPAEIAETSLALNQMLEARRRAELLLQESEHRYHTVIDQTGQMIYDVNLLTGRIAWFGTQAVERTTGYDLAEFPVTDLAGCEEFTHPDDRAASSARFEQCLATGAPYHMEYRFRQKDGSYRLVEDHGVFLAGPHGRPERMLGRMSDISDRRRATEALRQIIDLVPHFIFAKDAAGRFVLANLATARAYGTTPQNLVGKTDADFSLDKSEISNFLSADHAVLESGQPRHIPEEPFTDQTGRTRFLSTVKIPFQLAGNSQPTVLGVSVDITDLKRAAEDRQRIEKKLLETQKLESLGVLAGGIAHDFNNLLTGILGNASLARLDLPATSPLRPLIDQIELAGHRAADLCRQMLAYSGKGRFVVQRLDLNQLIGDTAPLLHISISKNCVLRFELAPVLPAVTADATQLRQIIMNLIINASEAIGHHQGLIGLSTGVMRADQEYLATARHATETVPGNYVFLEVGDNGAGMDAATLEKIFDPFFTTKFTGRGLGLAAVLGIIRGHKGALKVDSTPGRGTTFRMLLPCADGSAEVFPSASAARDPDWHGRGTVLVVDDEEAVRAVSVRILNSLGFAAVLATDGSDAVAVYRKEPARFAFVLLDLTMPQMDGEETFVRLRELNPDVRVILMSGFNQQEAVDRFAGKGLAGFVQKPFDFDAMLAAVRQVPLAD